MKKWNIALAVLLGVQIGLIVFGWTRQTDIGAFTPQTPLLSFQKATVDTIVIQGPDNTTVQLKKTDGEWLLPKYYDAPAKPERVKTLLDKLAGLKAGWPVATTPQAAKRFKVAPDNFERHILLKSGDTVIDELFTGTSPSFRKVHVRLPDSNNITTAAFASYDAPVKAEEWLDKGMVALKADDIIRIAFGDFILVRRDKNLVLEDPAPEEQADPEKISKLVGRLTDLQISAIVGREQLPEYGLNKPALTCRITLASGRKLIWTFGKLQKKDSYVLKTSDQDLLFKIQGRQVKPLLEVKRDTLVKKKETTQKTPDASKQSTTPKKP